MEERTACALCAGEAALFCEPDAAFLCWPCDASVHSANFLVARHVRLLACAACRSVDDRRCVSGPDPTRVRYLCAPCDHLALPSPSHSTSASSSSCLSTSDSTVAPRAANLIMKRRQRPVGESRVEQVLLGWGRRMGLRSPRRCAEVAARVIGACRGVVRFPSLRSMLAAALWFAVKHCEGGAAEPRRAVVLRWLEACSGVPARLILVAESRVGRVAERDRVAEEGSAECSPPRPPRFRQREKID